MDGLLPPLPLLPSSQQQTILLGMRFDRNEVQAEKMSGKMQAALALSSTASISPANPRWLGGQFRCFVASCCRFVRSAGRAAEWKNKFSRAQHTNTKIASLLEKKLQHPFRWYSSNTAFVRYALQFSFSVRWSVCLEFHDVLFGLSMQLNIWIFSHATGCRTILFAFLSLLWYLSLPFPPPAHIVHRRSLRDRWAISIRMDSDFNRIPSISIYSRTNTRIHTTQLLSMEYLCSERWERGREDVEIKGDKSRRWQKLLKMWLDVMHWIIDCILV